MYPPHALYLTVLVNQSNKLKPGLVLPERDADFERDFSAGREAAFEIDFQI